MMRGPEGWWRRKSTPAKFETYTRWSFHFLALIEVPSIGLAAVGGLGPGLGALLLALTVAHAAVSMVTVSRGLDWTRGRRPQPVRLLGALAAVTAGAGLAALLVARAWPDSDRVATAAGMVFGIVMVVGAGISALALRGLRPLGAVVAAYGLAACAANLALGVPWSASLITAAGVLVGGGFIAFTAFFSVWLLDAVYALDEARETRARLAVAEERLRFGRDLHDVMGRNLAVVALKSELAVQLARRGRAEAVEQMIEVQRIARETQREVRDVVRGYREADLGVELAGARGVLAAAGIACEVRGEAVGLPDEVQSALGWVVREATTNVLRHGNAGRCGVRLETTEGRVVLTVENDGAGDVRGGGGSGLAGLRERLAEVGGTLEAGPAGGELFRLVARVPLTAAEVTA